MSTQTPTRREVLAASRAGSGLPSVTPEGFAHQLEGVDKLVALSREPPEQWKAFKEFDNNLAWGVNRDVLKATGKRHSEIAWEFLRMDPGDVENVGKRREHMAYRAYLSYVAFSRSGCSDEDLYQIASYAWCLGVGQGIVSEYKLTIATTNPDTFDTDWPPKEILQRYVDGWTLLRDESNREKKKSYRVKEIREIIPTINGTGKSTGADAHWPTIAEMRYEPDKGKLLSDSSTSDAVTKMAERVADMRSWFEEFKNSAASEVTHDEDE